MNDHAEHGAADSAVMVPQPAVPSGSPHGLAPGSPHGLAPGSPHGLAPGSPHGLAPGAVPEQESESRRASVRDALDTALSGAALRSRDRQFLARLVKWDKRNAASVVSLLWRARLAGRAEAALTQRQLEIVLTALRDAAAYRISGADSLGCWDCENVPAGRCAEHAKDQERADACTELASVLAARKVSPGGLPQPSDIAGDRRFSTVAS